MFEFSTKYVTGKKVETPSLPAGVNPRDIWDHKFDLMVGELHLSTIKTPEQWSCQTSDSAVEIVSREGRFKVATTGDRILIRVFGEKSWLSFYIDQSSENEQIIRDSISNIAAYTVIKAFNDAVGKS